MPIKNPKDLLLDAVKFPAAIEAKLPEGAPKISAMLADAAGKIPAIPDFPMEIPDLPAVPTLPEAPAGLRSLGRPFVTGVTVRPVGGGAPLPLAGAGGGSWKETPVAAAGVVGQGHTVRDYA